MDLELTRRGLSSQCGGPQNHLIGRIDSEDNFLARDQFQLDSSDLGSNLEHLRTAGKCSLEDAFHGIYASTLRDHLAGHIFDGNYDFRSQILELAAHERLG